MKDEDKIAWAGAAAVGVALATGLWCGFMDGRNWKEKEMASKSVERRITEQCPFEAAPLKVIVRRVTEEKTPGGIVMPANVNPGTHEGVVVAVGPGPVLDSGVRENIPWTPGDHVLFDDQHGNQLFKFRGVDYFALNWRAVYAKVKPKTD